MKLNISEFIIYLKADFAMRGQKFNLINFLKDPISRFHFYMRFQELLQGRFLFKPVFIITKILFLRLSIRLGFSIPINTLGKGVYLPHYGTIIVNQKAKVGAFSVLNVDVVIGRHPTSRDKVPIIGDYVYLAPGVKIFGDIHVGNHCVVGANSVVTKSLEENMLCMGIPAQQIQVVPKELADSYGVEPIL